MTKILSYDNEWLSRIAAGDQVAFNSLYNSYKDKVFAVALNYLRDADDATEVTQRIFVRFWEKRSNFLEVESLNEYILVTARYAIFDYLRYLYRQVKLIQRSRSTDNEGSDPDDSIDLKTLTCIWHAIIRRLPSQQRSVYELVEMQGLSLDEVAGQLGLQKETIKSYLKLARKCVRQEMYQEMRAGGFSGEYTLAIIFLLFF